MSATIEQAIRAILVADTDVAAIVSTRIRPHAAVQGTSLPLGIYQRISGTHFHHLNPTNNGISGMAYGRIQYDWYTETFDEGADLAEKARLALDGYSGTVTVSGVGTLVVESVWLDDDASEYVEPQSAEGVGIWRHRQDWIATWAEAVPST